MPKGRRAKKPTTLQTKATVVKQEEEFDPRELIKKGKFDGFDQYGIKWDKGVTNFEVSTDEGVDFYGWWRKTRTRGSEITIYAIDIFAKRDMNLKGNLVTREFTIDSITYTQGDPRRNMKSMNADICAAMNRWFHYYLHDNAKRIDHLIRQAEHPTVKFTKIEQLDSLILRLKEHRQVCITSGGQRLFEFHGDEGGAKVHVVVNVTPQAIALEGKPPPIGRGAITDHAIKTGGARDAKRVTMPSHKIAGDNLDSMLNTLDAARKSGDKQLQRQIRAQLRKMGHKGGSRGRNHKE